MCKVRKKISCQHLAIYSSTHHPLVLACKHRAHKEQCLLLLHQQQQEHQEVLLLDQARKRCAPKVSLDQVDLFTGVQDGRKMTTVSEHM